MLTTDDKAAVPRLANIQPDALYRTRQAAELSGLHPETVKNWVKRGKLRAKRVGGSVGYVILGRDLIAAWEEVGSSE